MFSKITILLAVFAVSARLAVAEPPACLLSVANSSDNPGDLSAICSSKNVLSSLREECGDDYQAALDAYTASCKASGETPSKPSSSGSKSSSDSKSSSSSTKSSKASKTTDSSSATGGASTDRNITAPSTPSSPSGSSDAESASASETGTPGAAVKPVASSFGAAAIMIAAIAVFL
ncbi:MAG: hypothetical protein M1825_003357 [Sarcosagium campestre]|nr:MAG: hypothetical protein M1825_003357 [Sarcosagium campestre]